MGPELGFARLYNLNTKIVFYPAFPWEAILTGTNYWEIPWLQEF